MLKKTVLSLKSAAQKAHPRSLTKLSPEYKESLDDKMQAWQIHSYGGPKELRLTNVRIPMIVRPTDVLIRVEAASVNPIDVAITRGYGATILNLLRKARSISNSSEYDQLELPLTLGRDFSGTVVSKGHNVGDRLKLGDNVWGVVPVECQGCHANYVVVDNSLVNPKPLNLSHIEAASIPYAGLTAWSALWITGGLCYKSAITMRMNKRVLVLGGSGGVGSLAIQLLKAWDMHVITTCSSDAVNFVERLGADVVIDYKQPEADSNIVSEGPYDIILDCANQGPEQIKLKRYPHHTYITLNSPMLKNIDDFGLMAGAAKNIGDLLKYNNPVSDHKSCVKWGFFAPSQTGFNVLQELVENGQIIPVAKKVYSFADLPAAYERVSQGHLRGKIVIDMME